MFELINVGENTYYINAPAKIGIYKTNNEDVYLIDSGSDKDAGKKVKKILDEKGWKLKGIINTHSNADHIGGNKYLQQQTGCRIFASGIEAAFTNCPILEPSFLYGGYPCSDLRHKFLLAQESDCSFINDTDFPNELEIIALKGHFFDMIGIRTPDDVVFIADCVASENTLKKYRIPFIYDVKEYINTLDYVKELKAKLFVPSHAEACENITDLAQFNKDAVFEIAEKIMSVLNVPMCFEELLKKLFDDYNLTMNFEQYVLVGSTVRSFLSWLKDEGKIKAEFKDNLLVWSSMQKEDI